MILKPDNVFYSADAESFEKQFDTEEKCLAYLAALKWTNGFYCRKCGHAHSVEGGKAWSRRCTRCKTTESATAHTIFHHCRLPLVIAFKMVHTICNNLDISSWELSRQFGIRQMTCWKQLKKIRECVGEDRHIFLIPDDGPEC